MNRLYTVTLTDLGTYEVTVAAGTPGEAQSIAKTVLYDEMTHLPDGTRIMKRDTEAVAEPAEVLARQYRVSGTYSIDFEMTVSASNPQEAGVHARRLYEEACSPFEFEVSDSDVRWNVAREVQP